MGADDSGVPPNPGEPPNKFYKPTEQAFSRGTASPEGNAGETSDGFAGSLAPLLPLQGRLLASLIANSLTGLSLGARLLLTIATVIFIVREMVETRRDWYAGSNAVEQVELTRIQQQREKAEVMVAETASRKNIQEELTAIAQREVSSLQAMKTDLQLPTDGRLFGRTVEANSSFSRVYRYSDLYDQAKKKSEECGKNSNCSEVERRRLTSTMDLYFMLTQDARAGYRAMVDNKVDHPLYAEKK
jgi:hypothetical protein